MGNFNRLLHFSRKHFSPFLNIIQSHGYTAEEHVVHTDDGYLLTLHRIGRGVKPTQAKRKDVVFLQHGLLCSSVDWIVSGPTRGLPYLLVDGGFDVWLGNARGNSYSRQHVSLDPKKEAFWQFSWHEVGIYDLPAMIDYALNATRHDSLHYIGYSQGSTAFLVMASMREEYNKKVALCQALAPVAFLADSKSLFLKALAPFSNQFKSLFEFLGHYEILPNRKMLRQPNLVDKSKLQILQSFYESILLIIAKHCCEQIDPKLLPLVFQNTPAGVSINQIVHYAQCMKTGSFSQFDFGAVQNLVKYGTKTPPEYPLHEITVPTVFHIAENDIFTSLNDVNKLTGKLPKHIGNFRVPSSKFNHLDFIYAMHVRSMVYEIVIDVLKNTHKG